MAIYLTNGKYYIANSNTGAVIKVKRIEDAHDFQTVRNAIKQKANASKKTRGYYCINTESENYVINFTRQNNVRKVKRIHFTKEQRLAIYKKTEGHCYLCGEFTDLNSFEIEHRLPIAKGGDNRIENLFCSCHVCNKIKHDIYPEDFMKKITQIFMFQMQERNGNSLKWKMIHKKLQKMV